MDGDGPPPATFTVPYGIRGIKRAMCACGTVNRRFQLRGSRVSAESAGAVASNVFLESLTTRQSGRVLSQSDPHNLMAQAVLLLAHL